MLQLNVSDYAQKKTHLLPTKCILKKEQWEFSFGRHDKTSNHNTMQISFVSLEKTCHSPTITSCFADTMCFVWHFSPLSANSFSFSHEKAVTKPLCLSRRVVSCGRFIRKIKVSQCWRRTERNDLTRGEILESVLYFPEWLARECHDQLGKKNKKRPGFINM